MTASRLASRLRALGRRGARLLALGALGGLSLTSVAGCDRARQPGAAEPTCDERERAFHALMVGERELARECAADHECVAVHYDTDCARGCSGVLSKAGAAELARRVSEANRGPCQGFRDAGCSAPEPSCAPQSKPVCRAGKCAPER